jgi:hypothetical protein
MSRRKKDTQPLWRPNFVNQSTLPDIKVVRTGFIINFFAVTLALWVAFILIKSEYRTHVLNQTITAMQARIKAAEPKDAESLKVSEAFRSSAQYIVELEKFYDSPISIYQFIFDLSKIKPDDLIFNSISFKESVVKVDNKSAVAYNINISGDAKNLTVLDDFKRILDNDELLQIEGFALDINETLEGRNEKTGIFPYRLKIVLTPQAGSAGKGRKSGGDAS